MKKKRRPFGAIICRMWTREKSQVAAKAEILIVFENERDAFILGKDPIKNTHINQATRYNHSIPKEPNYNKMSRTPKGCVRVCNKIYLKSDKSLVSFYCPHEQVVPAHPKMKMAMYNNAP